MSEFLSLIFEFYLIDFYFENVFREVSLVLTTLWPTLASRILNRCLFLLKIKQVLAESLHTFNYIIPSHVKCN